MPYAAFRSIGAYVPENVLTNEDLTKMVDTSDEWITKRTGIKERHIASKEEKTSDMGTKAAQKALERAGMKSLRIISVCLQLLRSSVQISVSKMQWHLTSLQRVPALSMFSQLPKRLLRVV